MHDLSSVARVPFALADVVAGSDRPLCIRGLQDHQEFVVQAIPDVRFRLSWQWLTQE